MSATVVVTFGQQYRREAHPVDCRAHPDGWFEFEAESPAAAVGAANTYLTPPGATYAPYAFTYDKDDHEANKHYYPAGCLARFRATSDRVEEVKRDGA